MKFQTYIINLRKDEDRLLFMEKQLRENDMDYIVEEAVDGKNYDFSDIYNDEEVKSITGKSMSDSEKGCALSHRNILGKICKDNIDYSLILEDDVEIPNNFKQIVNTEIDRRTSGKTCWEYLSFNYPSVGIKYIKLWLFLFFHMIKDQNEYKIYLLIPIYIIKFILISIMSLFEGIREIIYKKIFKNGKIARFYRPLYLAGCYIITRDGAEKLLGIQEKIIYTADRLPNIARVTKGLKFFAYVPLLVKQRREKFKSNIMKEDKYFFNN